jgi:hypothetical protein
VFFKCAVVLWRMAVVCDALKHKLPIGARTRVLGSRMQRKHTYSLGLNGSKLRLVAGDAGHQLEPLQPDDVIRVEPSSSVSSLISEAVEFPIVEASTDTWKFGNSSDGLLLAGMQFRDWRSVASAHKSQLVDLLLTLNLRPCQEDFVYIGDLSTGHQWVLSVNCTTKPNRAALAPCGAKSFETLWPTLSAAYRSRNGAQAYAQLAFGLLTNAVDGFAFPAHLPLFDDAAELKERRIQLTVRVKSRSLWPLAIPLDHFQAYDGYGRFSHYSGIEWILTDKTFLQNALERQSLQRALSDPDQTLPYAVFIINDYAKFHTRLSKESKLARDGITLATQVMELMCSKGSQGRTPGLGLLLLGPDAGQLTRALGDESTRYVFGNFHTVDGEWMMSDFPHPPSRPSFSLKELGKLSHVRFMQLFHCESAPTMDGPLDRHSICENLLAGGVGRVSGSAFDDHFLAYLCWLLRFVYHNSRWRARVKQMAADRSLDAEKLLEAIPRYLDACGLQVEGSH